MSTASSIWLEFVGRGVSETFYDVKGICTRVLEAGSPTSHPLIMLHGTGGHAETYHRNIGPLSEHFRVYAIDMIGHGYTDRPDVAYNLDDYTAHVCDFLDVIGAPAAHLSGESLGGCVAAWTAITRPERVSKLVLNTGVLARPDEAGLRQLADLEQRTHSLRDDCSLAAIRRRLEWLVADPLTMTDEIVHIRHRIYNQPGMVDSVLRIMGAVLEMNRGVYGDVDYIDQQRLREIKCPTMVIWTDKNPGKSFDVVSGAIAELPDPEVHLIYDAAHWPQFEKPDEVNRHHVDFLTRAG